MNNVYLRKDGRWEGRIYVGSDNSGKRRYISFYGHTRESVEQKIADYLNENNKSFSFNFRDLFTEWIEYVSLSIKESTASNYRMKADKHLIPFFSGNCSEINENHVQKFILKKRKEGLSDRYIADMIVLLKSVFKFGRKRYQYNNPTDGLRFSFKKSESVKLLEPDEYSTLQKTLSKENSLTSASIALAAATGLRIGELCALQWGDIDLKKRIMTVRKTVQRIKSNDGKSKTKIIIASPKTESSKREIPVPECIVSIIEKFKKNDNDYVLSGSEKVTEPRTLQYRFSRILKNVNLPSIHFHALRHMFATKCIQSGIDIKTLSEILGHSRVETTLNRYVHSSFAHKAEAINSLKMDF